ncbi:MAG: CmcI family methyltransferase [Nocardioides sp.]
MSIYSTLIDEIAPKTIIELGTGSGASAHFFADAAAASGRVAHVITIDRVPVRLARDNIEFRYGDMRDLPILLPLEEFQRMSRPILVVEDAHAHLPTVLTHLDKALQTGDYLIVEDSLVKRAQLLEFLSSCDGRYELDCRYTDMFGENVTCSVDSILVRC